MGCDWLGRQTQPQFMRTSQAAASSRVTSEDSGASRSRCRRVKMSLTSLSEVERLMLCAHVKCVYPHVSL